MKNYLLKMAQSLQALATEFYKIKTELLPDFFTEIFARESESH